MIRREKHQLAFPPQYEDSPTRLRTCLNQICHKLPPLLLALFLDFLAPFMVW